MDRLTSLTVFARVADSGGFSAAARRLNMSTTMVSNHVQALEERLGARLLNRTTRKVSLTEVGKLYYQRCTQILADLEQADEIAGALHTTPSGTLRLYMSAHVVRFIAPVVAEFLAAYPEARVDLTMGERLADLVEEGFDLAIRTTPSPESSVIVRPLTRWRHILCCAPAYLEAHGEPRVLADLARHNCLCYAYYPLGEAWHFTGPDGRPATVQPTGTLVSGSGEALRVAALRGLGIFLAPAFLAAEDLSSGRLVPILQDWRPVEFAISAVYPHRHLLSAKVRAFIDLLAARIGAFRQWMTPELGLGAEAGGSAS